jgi:hypothetical protein
VASILLLHFREHVKKAIEKVASEQLASYLKILTLLVPRERQGRVQQLVEELD